MGAYCLVPEPTYITSNYQCSRLTNPFAHSSSLHILLPQYHQLWCSNSKPLNLSALSALSASCPDLSALSASRSDLSRSLLTPFQGTSTTAFSRMPNQRKPKGRPMDHFVIQYDKAKPRQRGSEFKIKAKRISKFRTYGELELYMTQLSGGGHRIYPGGADYPVITYNKYKDEDTVERELRTEPWKTFAASVEFVFIKRVEA